MARVLSCDDCGKTPNVVELAPMLHDAVWCKLAARHEMLCAECMFTRAAARDVRLSLASLQPCEFNLMCSPVSWFELFASIEITPPKNLDAWRAVAAGFRNESGTQLIVLSCPAEVADARWGNGTERTDSRFG